MNIRGCDEVDYMLFPTLSIHSNQRGVLFFPPKVKVLLSAQPFVFTSTFSRCLLPFSHPSLPPSVQSKRNGRHSSGSAAAAREHQGREAAK